MPAPHPRTKITDLKVGQYFKDRTTWYQVAYVPDVQADSDYRLYLTVRTRYGGLHGHFVYGVSVEVTPDNRRPVTWTGTALRREADRLQRRVDLLLDQVAGLRGHAKRADKEG